MRTIVFWAMLIIFQILWTTWGFDFLRAIRSQEELSSGFAAARWLAVWLVVYLGYIGGLTFVYFCPTTQASDKRREFWFDFCNIFDTRFPGKIDHICATRETEKFTVPNGTKEFWVNLEDTDAGDPIEGGTVYHANVTYHLDRKKMAYDSNDDMLHVTIADNGEYVVRYIGNEYTNADVGWSISAEYT